MSHKKSRSESTSSLKKQHGKSSISSSTSSMSLEHASSEPKLKTSLLTTLCLDPQTLLRENSSSTSSSARLSPLPSPSRNEPYLNGMFNHFKESFDKSQIPFCFKCHEVEEYSVAYRASIECTGYKIDRLFSDNLEETGMIPVYREIFLCRSCFSSVREQQQNKLVNIHIDARVFYTGM